jgi:hypothetical protein
MSKIKLIIDFFRLWIHWGDKKEAWQDAKMINDIGFQEEMKEFDTDSFEEPLTSKELLEIVYMDYTNKFKPASHTPEPLSLMEFVTHIKNDERFAKAWGLTIEERELSLGERKKLYEDEFTPGMEVTNDNWLNSKLTTRNIPTKLIILTYNNDTIIESYE